ncbi:MULTISPECIES: photosystem II complex extrinsic protein PsbU [unclassified Synechococcus]|jgi:photosystem II PsbU protein|uniref:photosystem II complex extrinsic protein PsbU n=1 Tax=unclassified Synechococcus TaxID=2626047 RepID=UPI000B98E9F6|nr:MULTISPECIES: photosystem II complex extrinsic protein PsbU [unclassified Synechococcus]MCP9829698.1 photosystem II complex extrinsic protein PsbU [Synechococcus sp. L2F]MCP9848080.1 photosystem II complex extrinsic protein PsbU [Synechococcus sp. Lug-A]MCT0210947.1 photosystem II complex extrinsic protein PsbU [Synechococcus sp. CS-1333]PZV22460.1 MAG: photosystem II complex extrinsic protein precursor U [Cyanobium sp.]
MKRVVAWLMSGVLLAGLLMAMALPPAAFADAPRNVADDKIAAAVGKVDLNNSPVRSFQQFPGMYPTLAGKIVLGGPYESIDDVLSLDLTERQKELFEKYRDNFTITPPSIALNEGFDRINNGVYR